MKSNVNRPSGHHHQNRHGQKTGNADGERGDINAANKMLERK
jgi:hypothetical protein